MPTRARTHRTRRSWARSTWTCSLTARASRATSSWTWRTVRGSWRWKGPAQAQPDHALTLTRTARGRVCTDHARPHLLLRCRDRGHPRHVDHGHQEVPGRPRASRPQRGRRRRGRRLSERLLHAEHRAPSPRLCLIHFPPAVCTSGGSTCLCPCVCVCVWDGCAWTVLLLFPLFFAQPTNSSSVPHSTLVPRESA
jgi:hypothetical protein